MIRLDRCPPECNVRGRRRSTAALVFVLAVSLSPPGVAAIFVVDNATFDLGDIVKGDGICAFFGTAPGACTLRAAIQEANALPGTDLILLPAGTYVLSLVGQDDDATYGDLDVTGAVGIFGAGPGESVVDADGVDRIFDILTPVSVSVWGVTLTGGNTADVGGAVRVVPEGASLTLGNCRIYGNMANSGGAVHSFGATTIERCSFSANRAQTGTITNPDGGAIWSHGTLDVDSSSFSSNVADGFGGAIVLYNAIGATIVASTISGNSPSGIDALNTTFSLESTTVAFHSESGLDATACCGNSALVSLTCSIIAKNAGSQCGLLGSIGIVSNGGNVFEDSTCGFGFTDLMADPLLGGLTSRGGHLFGHVPQPGSPAIDGGHAGCSAPDLWGVARPMDGDGDGLAVADAGAVEVVPPGWIFGDGFESGSDSAWTSSTP